MEPDEPGYETVVSQIAREVFGGANAAYYYIQFATMAILVLAANTAYSDFPRLAYFLARDRYMPRQFTFRGDRLAFTTGIVTLGLIAGAGAGALRRRDRAADPALRARRLHLLHDLAVRHVRALAAATGAGLASRAWSSTWSARSATGVVAIVVAVTKFTARRLDRDRDLIPLLILMMRAIHRHYTDARDRAGGADAARSATRSSTP